MTRGRIHHRFLLSSVSLALLMGCYRHPTPGAQPQPPTAPYAHVQPATATPPPPTGGASSRSPGGAPSPAAPDNWAIETSSDGLAFVTVARGSFPARTYRGVAYEARPKLQVRCKQGEMFMELDPDDDFHPVGDSTILQVAIDGGAPQEIRAEVPVSKASLPEPRQLIDRLRTATTVSMTFTTTSSPGAPVTSMFDVTGFDRRLQEVRGSAAEWYWTCD